MILFLKLSFKVTVGLNFYYRRFLLTHIFIYVLIAKQTKRIENNLELDRGQLLELALAWDAIEIANEYIIKDDLNDLTVRGKRIKYTF